MAEGQHLSPRDSQLHGRSMDKKSDKTADVSEVVAIHDRLDKDQVSEIGTVARGKNSVKENLPDLVVETKTAVRQMLGKEEVSEEQDCTDSEAGEAAVKQISENLKNKGGINERDDTDEGALGNEVQEHEGNGDRDPDRGNSPGNESDNTIEDDVEEEEECFDENVSSQENEAQPIVETDCDAMGVEEEDEPKRLEDVFLKNIIPRFADVTEFKKYARSERGLRLPENKISNLLYKNPNDPNWFMFSALKLWEQIYKGNDAAERIIEKTDAYFASYADSVPVGNNSGAEATPDITGAEGGPNKRFEDVFQDQIIPSFADLGEFKTFAISKNGLKLSSVVVSNVVESNPTDQMMKMLNIWRQNKDATPELIIKIRKNYTA